MFPDVFADASRATQYCLQRGKGEKPASGTNRRASWFNLTRFGLPAIITMRAGYDCLLIERQCALGFFSEAILIVVPTLRT